MRPIPGTGTATHDLTRLPADHPAMATPMRYRMTRADRHYRARTLLSRAGYRTSTPKNDVSGVRTLLLVVDMREDDDPGCVARIVHGSDPDARRLP